VFDVETIDDLLINFVAGRDVKKDYDLSRIISKSCTFLFSNIATFYQSFSLLAKTLLNFKVKPLQ
jgi:hypothetical protein